MAKVITVINLKGGTIKSSLVASVGIGIAEKGYKVLLIDTDPQGSLTASLGIDEPDEDNYTLAEIVDFYLNDKEEDLDLNKFIKSNSEGVDFLAANIMLCETETKLIIEPGSEMILKSIVEKIRSSYDYIMIDCAPALSQMTINALACADSVIIPSEPTYLSTKGLQQLLRTIRKVRKKFNPELKISGMVFTKVKSNTNNAKQIIQALRNSYGEAINIFETSIPDSIKAAEAPGVGLSIYKHSPKSSVAKAYRSLVEEVLGNV